MQQADVPLPVTRAGASTAAPTRSTSAIYGFQHRSRGQRRRDWYRIAIFLVLLGRGASERWATIPSVFDGVRVWHPAVNLPSLHAFRQVVPLAAAIPSGRPANEAVHSVISGKPLRTVRVPNRRACASSVGLFMLWVLACLLAGRFQARGG